MKAKRKKMKIRRRGEWGEKEGRERTGKERGEERKEGREVST